MLPYQPLTRSRSSPRSEDISTLNEAGLLHTLTGFMYALKLNILSMLHGNSASCCSTLVDFLTRTGFTLAGVHKTREQFRHTRQAGHSFDFVARRHSSGPDLRRKMLR